jgi:hypothetical protein
MSNELRRNLSATGVVIYNDKPVPNVSVIFSPKSGGRTATGSTNEEGRFELTTFEAGDGAILGEHTVTLTPSQKSRKTMSLASKHTQCRQKPKGRSHRNTGTLIYPV